LTVLSGGARLPSCFGPCWTTYSQRKRSTQSSGRTVAHKEIRFERSKTEFQNNLAWLKTTLEHPSHDRSERQRGQELLHDLRALAIEQPVGNDAGDGAISSDEIFLKSELVVDDVLAYVRKQSQEAPSSTNPTSNETGTTHPTPAQAARIAVLAGTTLSVLAALWAFRNAVALLIMAIVLSWAMRPLQAGLSSRRLVRVPAIFAMYLGLLVVPAVAGYFVVPLIAANMEQAIRQLAKLHQELPKRWAEGTTLPTDRRQPDRTDGRHLGGRARRPYRGAIRLGRGLGRDIVWHEHQHALRDLPGGVLERRRRSVPAPVVVAPLWLATPASASCLARGRVGGRRLYPPGSPAESSGCNGRGRLVGRHRIPFATALALLTLAAWFVPWLGVALVLLSVWVAVGINYLRSRR
jgi:hypothetical protein